MSARQGKRRTGEKNKTPRARGRACIFDNYSTVDLRTDGLRIGGTEEVPGGRVKGGGEERGRIRAGRTRGRWWLSEGVDCGVAGVVSESRVQPSGSYEYII